MARKGRTGSSPVPGTRWKLVLSVKAEVLVSMVSEWLSVGRFASKVAFGLLLRRFGGALIWGSKKYSTGRANVQVLRCAGIPCSVSLALKPNRITDAEDKN